MAKKAQQKDTEWYRKPWATIIGSLLTAFSIFGGGYAAGEYRKGVSSDLELMTVKQEFYTRIQQEIRDCQQSQLKEHESKINNLTQLIEALSKTKNERKR